MNDDLAAQDAEHLRLLSILHYVMAGLMSFVACFPIIHFVIGGTLFFASLAGHGKDGAPPALVGGFFMLVAGTVMLVGWTMVICVAMAGRFLAQRRRRVFCMVVGGVLAGTCVPLGTALGIFTIIVLQRPSVVQAFEGTNA